MIVKLLRNVISCLGFFPLFICVPLAGAWDVTELQTRRQLGKTLCGGFICCSSGPHGGGFKSRRYKVNFNQKTFIVKKRHLLFNFS